MNLETLIAECTAYDFKLRLVNHKNEANEPNHLNESAREASIHRMEEL